MAQVIKGFSNYVKSKIMTGSPFCTIRSNESVLERNKTAIITEFLFVRGNEYISTFVNVSSNRTGRRVH